MRKCHCSRFRPSIDQIFPVGALTWTAGDARRSSRFPLATSYCLFGKPNHVTHTCRRRTRDALGFRSNHHFKVEHSGLCSAGELAETQSDIELPIPGCGNSQYLNFVPLSVPRLLSRAERHGRSWKGTSDARNFYFLQLHVIIHSSCESNWPDLDVSNIYKYELLVTRGLGSILFLRSSIASLSILLGKISTRKFSIK